MSEDYEMFLQAKKHLSEPEAFDIVVATKVNGTVQAELEILLEELEKGGEPRALLKKRLEALKYEPGGDLQLDALSKDRV